MIFITLFSFALVISLPAQAKDMSQLVADDVFISFANASVIILPATIVLMGLIAGFARRNIEIIVISIVGAVALSTALNILTMEQKIDTLPSANNKEDKSSYTALAKVSGPACDQRLAVGDSVISPTMNRQLKLTEVSDYFYIGVNEYGEQVVIPKDDVRCIITGNKHPSLVLR